MCSEKTKGLKIKYSNVNTSIPFYFNSMVKFWAQSHIIYKFLNSSWVAIYRTKHGTLFIKIKERMDIKGNVANFAIVTSMESMEDIK